ncbi:MAG: WbqC family protein, partial [Deltaproteobacteria bacterium]|nr:WbqC family protein [Deltaproteobacteria bacterium]
MILSASQPYFAPYPGFFDKILRSDIFVILDRVQFPRGTTWVSRNRFKSDQGAMWMTIPVRKKGLGLQRIDQVRIDHEGRWLRKHIASLKNSYRNAPYFRDHFPFMEEIFLKMPERLVDLNFEIIRYIMRNMFIPTRVMLLSDLDIDARGDRLIIEICKRAGATTFLAQGGAKKFMDRALYSEGGIMLEFFKPVRPVYPQLWGDFIP